MHIVKVLFGFTLILMTGIGVIQADDAEDVGIPTFSDGRVNNWQIDAPLAVFCVFEEGDDGGVFQRVDVWGLNSDKLLEASAAQINAAAGAQVLDSSNGYTLAVLDDGSFEVSAPSGYAFNWQRGDANC